MKKQKGFSAVEGLIIIIIVAVIGFAGYTVLNRDDSTDMSNDTSMNDEAKDNSGTSNAENSEANPGDPEASENENTIDSEAWKTYGGDGFTFSYPENWDGYADQSDTWAIAAVEPADGFEIGGGFGPKIAYSAADVPWSITELGRFPGEQAIGDAFDLFSRTNESGVVVYDYTVGDGPASFTTLLFVVGDNMVKIALPYSCSDESLCEQEIAHPSIGVVGVSKYITDSVTIE